MAFGRIKNSENGLDKVEYNTELLSRLNVSPVGLHSAIEPENKVNDEEASIYFFKLKNEIRDTLID